MLLTKHILAIKLAIAFVVGVVLHLMVTKWSPGEYIMYQFDKIGDALCVGTALSMFYLVIWPGTGRGNENKFRSHLIGTLAVFCVLYAGVTLCRNHVMLHPDEVTATRMGYLKESGIESVASSGGYIVTEEWLAYNLYRVDSYVDRKDGTYMVFLLDIEPSKEETFEELKDTFYSTPYSTINSYHIADGIDCRGMTSYIAGWCQDHNRPYKISYTPSHTYITVQEEGKWYEFNFNRMPSVKEVEET